MLLFGIFGFFYVLFEIFLISICIMEFGFLTYIIFSILTALLGYYFVHKYGFSNFVNKVKVVKAEEVFRVFPTTIAGVLLMIPGILSSFLGFIFLASSYFLSRKIHESFNDMGEDIIDAEVVDEKQ